LPNVAHTKSRTSGRRAGNSDSVAELSAARDHQTSTQPADLALLNFSEVRERIWAAQQM
jgi:hypothetical protein